MKSLFKTSILTLVLLTISCSKDDTVTETSTETQILVSTLAGSTEGFADATGANAQFNRPVGITIDASNNLYVVDQVNHKIRKITPDGAVSTLAGSTQGFADGTGENAQFYFPSGITIDASNNLYVTDQYNHKIRKITPNGNVTTIAGSTEGFEDGMGASAKFKRPTEIAVDASNNLYVTDQYNHKIRKITPNGAVTTLAGSTNGYADGTGANAQFNFPRGITIDAANNLYVSDNNNHKVRKITANGVVTTLAGSTEGYADDTGTNAQFHFPRGITIDAANNLYIVDTSNEKIRKITASGEVSTLAGSTQGFTDGVSDIAQFSRPSSITVDTSNNLYITDTYNNKIRKITLE